MIISINGNIGSGKSTLMDSIKEEFKHFHHIQEPVHKWTKLLENFYNDPSKWALPFQIKVLTSQMSSFHEYENKICMVERDPITARYIFWESLYRNKTITPEEYDVYNKRLAGGIRHITRRLVWLFQRPYSNNTRTGFDLVNKTAEKRAAPCGNLLLNVSYYRRRRLAGP